MIKNHQKNCHGNNIKRKINKKLIIFMFFKKKFLLSKSLKLNINW